MCLYIYIYIFTFIAQKQGLSAAHAVELGIIAACQHCSDASWAMQLFQEMPRRTLKPNTSSYNALLAACEAATLWEECLSLLSHMQHQRLGLVGFDITEIQSLFYTLQGTNISPKNGILKMIFLFPRWDMLIPWRVCVHFKQSGVRMF